MREGSSQPLRLRVERGIFKRETRTGVVRYEISYTDDRGRQRWSTTDTLREARQLRADLVSKTARGEVIPETRALFADIAEAWFAAKAARVRPRTASYYRGALDVVLLPRFGRLRVAAIDADAIATLTRDLEREGLHAIDPARPVRPLGWSSVSNYLKPLQGVLALAVRRRVIASNPFDVLMPDDRPQRPERGRPYEWSQSEIAALLAASAALARRPESRYNYEPLLRLDATLGLRLGEILGLQWADFDAAAAQLHVRRQWLRSGEYGPPKTSRGTRTIDLPEETVSLLVGLRGNVRTLPGVEDDRPIFASFRGTPLGHRNVARRGFEPARDLAGLAEHLTFHQLRHAAASRLIAAGLPDVEIADILGHDVTTLRKIYSHVFDREARAEARRAALAMPRGAT